MKVQLKTIGLGIALLTSLNVSIPAATSRPSDSVVDKPWLRPTLNQKHNGAQVRVTFDLASGEQFSCNETSVKVTIVESEVSQPNQLVRYRTLGTYEGTASSASLSNACLYNFNLSQNFVGKEASVSVSGPVLPLRERRFIGGSDLSPLPIKSLRQTFNIKARAFYHPN
jgi:hypothetical protein